MSAMAAALPEKAGSRPAGICQCGRKSLSEWPAVAALVTAPLSFLPTPAWRVPEFTGRARHGCPC